MLTQEEKNDVFKTIVILNEMVEQKVITVPEALNKAFAEGLLVAINLGEGKQYKCSLNF